MRKKIVAGNWKMNNTIAEGKQLVSDIIALVNANKPSKSGAELGIVFGTPFTSLQPIAELVKGNPWMSVAAQNCYPAEKGAYTGETSVGMIKDAGATNVILGHSERREYFNESAEFLAKKVDICLANGLTPIFCCGEKLEVREAGNHFTLVKDQIKDALFHLEAADFAKVVIAYEPVWAIGTGVTASSAQAQEMHLEIRNFLASKYGQAVANDITILYGGSCNAKNAAELFANPDVDGGLIGGASLKAEDFMAIIAAI